MRDEDGGPLSGEPFESKGWLDLTGSSLMSGFDHVHTSHQGQCGHEEEREGHMGPNRDGKFLHYRALSWPPSGPVFRERDEQTPRFREVG